jgi:hypothetical protein
MELRGIHFGPLSSLSVMPLDRLINSRGTNKPYILKLMHYLSAVKRLIYVPVVT